MERQHTNSFLDGPNRAERPKKRVYGEGLLEMQIRLARERGIDIAEALASPPYDLAADDDE
jgi:hypothetical protein